MRMCCVAGASAALVLACSAHGAFVYTSTPGFGDADFLALTQGGSLERAVAESRIGNGATNGTWETAIWELGGQGAPKDQGQLNQQNGLTVPFSLSWDGVSTVTFSVGPETVSWNQVGGPFTDLFFRLRAGTGTQVEILNLSINGDAYAGSLFANQNQTLEYLRVQDMGGGNIPAFQMTGSQRLVWPIGNRPNNSALAYQIKMTNVIPTPGTMAIASLALAAGVRRRRS
jgi:uncharacterized protein (TIGR03382 family)